MMLASPPQLKRTNSILPTRTASLGGKASHVRVVVRVRPLGDGQKECLSVAQQQVFKPNVEPKVSATTSTEITGTSSNCAMENNLNDTSTAIETTTTVAAATAATTTPPRRKRKSLIPSSRKQKSPVRTPSTSTSSGNAVRKLAEQQEASPCEDEPPVLSTVVAVHGASPATSSCSPAAAAPAAREFTFDGVFPPTATQEQVYQSALGDSVQQNLYKGYNTTVLAYGQTGSGKTYTMGPSGAGDGIIPRAIRDVFAGKQAHEEEWDISIALHCLELLQEEFRDLLLPAFEQQAADSIKLRNLGTGAGVVVEGATQVPLHSVDHAMELVQLAATRRATSCTLRNEQSSRSHAIYSFLVTMQPRDKTNKAAVPDAMSARLTLVDLAGSEQIKKSGVVGAQAKESININKDLFVLGKVVSALADKNNKNNNNSSGIHHVPYRDSKLTQLLQDSLGGEFFA